MNGIKLMASILLKRTLLRNCVMYSITSLTLFILSLYLIFAPEIFGGYQNSAIILAIMFLVLLGFFILAKIDVIFEPIVVFSAYYISVLLSGIYFIVTDFNKAYYFQTGKMTYGYISLFNYALLYFFLGYIFTLLGYYLIKKNRNVSIQLETQEELPNNILNIVIIIFLTIGLANFAYNVLTMAGGSILEYMKNVAVRQLEYERHGGSDIGYLLYFTAMYLWYFKLIRQRKISIIFTIFLLVTIVIKASTGRIFGTLTYLGNFVVIYYFNTLSRKRYVNNRIYILCFMITGALGLLFYCLRILSSLEYSNMLNTNTFSLLPLFFQFDNILHFAVDKGNIPSIPIVMKIIRDWPSDIGYLWGSSLISTIFHVLPSSLRTVPYQASVMIKEAWYSSTLGGNLPPTGIGEMYANFGFLGPILGMLGFGMLCGFIYNYLLKSKSFWVLVVYSNILLSFILIYPKDEFDNFPIAEILPIIFTIWGIKFVVRASRHFYIGSSVREQLPPA